MNKYVNILVSMVFLISFIGVNIHKHYSNGKLYSFAIYEEADDCCADMDHCEMTDMHVLCGQHQQNNDCSCEDETETIKITDVFVRENCTCPNVEILSWFIVDFFDYSELIHTTRTNKIDYCSSPPPVEVNVQAEYCVFII